MPHLRPNEPPDYRSGWGSGGWGVHRASLPPSHGTFLEEARVRFRLGSGTEVGAAERGDRAAARRPAGAAGDLVGGLVRDLDAEDPGRAADDRGELAVLVVVEPERDPEAVAQR